MSLLAEYEETEWNRTLADERQPFFPRVAQMTVPPGSVFKVLTSVALLESGLIDPDAYYHCQGYLDRPDRDRCLIYRHYGVGHGDMNLESALCQSCNVYFFNAARRIGPQNIHDWAARFETTARELLARAEFAPLVDYASLGRDALLSAPTPDHYLPLVYVLAQHGDGDAVSFPVEGFDGGSISMLAVQIG